MSEFKKLTYPEYEELAKPLLKELARMARWLAETGQRIVVVFEGRDTAGKGGSIDAIARVLNPRQCRVAALPSPSDRERGQWYFQRYIPYLPAKGEITLFDRSWYNRAGVEPVMGFCTQEERFENRLVNPLKRWKLSPIDVQARTRYDAYTEARERMLEATHTEFAPWTLVEFNDQSLGRLTLLRDFLDRIPDTDLPVKEMEWPPLSGEPLRERYGVIQPVPAYPIASAPREPDGDSAYG
jgi:polyphosphate kinase 2 (PPK2 family)